MSLGGCGEYDFYDEAIGCTPCSILCEPDRGRLQECKTKCARYYEENMVKIIGEKHSDCGQYYYRDEAIGTCTPCSGMCDPSEGRHPDCQTLCPEYIRDHFQKVVTTTTNSTLGGEANDGPQDSNINMVIGFAVASAIVVVLIILVVILVRYKKSRNKAKYQGVGDGEDSVKSKDTNAGGGIDNIDMEMETVTSVPVSGPMHQCATTVEDSAYASNTESRPTDPLLGTGRQLQVTGHERPPDDSGIVDASDLPTRRPQDQTAVQIHDEPREHQKTTADVHVHVGDVAVNDSANCPDLGSHGAASGSHNSRPKDLPLAEVHMSCRSVQMESNPLLGRDSSGGPASSAIGRDSPHISENLRRDSQMASSADMHVSNSKPSIHLSPGSNVPRSSDLSLTEYPGSIDNLHQGACHTPARPSDHTVAENQPAAMDLSAPAVNLQENEEQYYAWGLSLEQDGAGAGGRSPNENPNRISTADYDYLDKQKWVRIIMTSGKKLEIMVKGKPSKEAKKEIVDNTGLHSSQLYVTTLKSSNFRYLDGGGQCLRISGTVWFKGTGPKKGQTLCSSTAGFLGDGSSDMLHYLVTSAHYSGEGTEYYSGHEMRQDQYLGKCKFCYWTDIGEWDKKLDIAFVELRDIPRTRLSNMLSLPLPWLGEQVSLREFLPRVRRGGLQHLEGTPLLKHGPQGLISGVLTIVGDRQAEDGPLRYAVTSRTFHTGVCLPGDSGSLVTSRPVVADFPHLPALGVVAGLRSIVAESDDSEEDDVCTDACVFTSLWVALERVYRDHQEDFTNMQFLAPVCRPSVSPESARKSLSPVTNRDTGFQSDTSNHNKHGIS